MNGDTISLDEAAAHHRCAACAGPFHCGAHDATPCWCANVKLTDATLTALQGRYVGCLCEPCLRAFSAAHTTPD